MMKVEQVVVDGRMARVWSGGEGGAILLLHGAWALAEPHWSPVWNRLAERHRVLAPDLPGIGMPQPEAPQTFAAYGDWVARLLDAVGAERAWAVGNSFGAAVAWSLASRHRDRCSGLVLVNGGPPPSLWRPVRWLLGRPAVQKRLTRMFARRVYSVETGPRAFVDPTRIPAAIAAVFAQPHPPVVDTVYAVMLGGGVPAPKELPALILWGAGDRLFGKPEAAAQRTQRTLPNAKLVLIPGAGHLPQVENPDAFADALLAFVG